MMSGSWSTVPVVFRPTGAAISEAHQGDGERRQWCHRTTFLLEENDSGGRMAQSRPKHVAMSGLYGRNSGQGIW